MDSTSREGPRRHARLIERPMGEPLSGVVLMRLEEEDAGSITGGGAPDEASMIDVWRCSLRHPPLGTADLRSTLSSDELDRCARLRASSDRRRYATARGVLRLVLGRYVDEAPGELEFGYGEAGKPSLRRRDEESRGSPVHFNLSHSGELLLIAVSRAVPVGIDVERIRPLARMEEIARRWLSAEEYRAIRRAPSESESSRLFFTAWAAAEARAKAQGAGMWAAKREREARESSPERPPVVFRPAEGYVAAVACGAPVTSVGPAGRARLSTPRSTP